jgi:hypothetical protein
VGGSSDSARPIADILVQSPARIGIKAPIELGDNLVILAVCTVGMFPHVIFWKKNVYIFLPKKIAEISALYKSIGPDSDVRMRFLM